MSAPTLKYFPRSFGQYEPSVALSFNGRYLAYVSYLEGGRLANVFVHDTVAASSRVITALPGYDNYSAVLASNGTALAFTTWLPGSDGLQQIAVADLGTGNISFASTAADGAAANGDSRYAAVSADGRYVAFESAASNLVAGDTNGSDDVFVKDMQTGAVRRVSLSAGGGQLDGNASDAQISANGNVVLFRSLAEVMPGLPSQSFQLYARNLATGALAMVSADSEGQPANADAEQASLSADGRYVVFSSAAAYANDSNPNVDIFRKDLVTGAIEIVSANAAGVQGGGRSADPSISADGRYVSFSYDGQDLIPTMLVDTSEIYVKDMLSGEIIQVSQGSEVGQNSVQAAISGDGSHLAFITYAGMLGDNYDLTWDVALATLAPAATVPAAPAPTPAAPDPGPVNADIHTAILIGVPDYGFGSMPYGG